MKLSIEEVEKIATLARLELSQEEKQHHAETLSVVLSYMDILNEVNTEGVPETTQVTGLTNVVREDIPRDASPIQREILVQSFPEREDDLLKVQAVFE